MILTRYLATAQPKNRACGLFGVSANFPLQDRREKFFPYYIYDLYNYIKNTIFQFTFYYNNNHHHSRPRCLCLPRTLERSSGENPMTQRASRNVSSLDIVLVLDGGGTPILEVLAPLMRIP